MTNGKRISAVDAQFYLPDAIIQRIQSFLSRKEAASTAVLSKSWYNSWLTRPILDFDERDFQIDDGFLNFVTRSMERYHGLDLNIDSFKLWMNVNDIESSSLANELIVKALKMGANDFNLEFSPPVSEYLMPKELFESESLEGLSAAGCMIPGVGVMCSLLKSLFLRQVCVTGDMIKDIISECPLLENLILCDCEGFEEVNVGKMVNLKSFSVIKQANTPARWGIHDMDEQWGIPLIKFEEQTEGSVIGDWLNVSEFCNLSYLLLERVEIDKMLFCDFSSKFPCVKDLTVRYCNGCVKFYISSHALNYITLAHSKKLEIQLDVPNIRKFTFSGAVIPSLSIVSASGAWESDIALYCWKNIGISWFIKLKGFLINLSLSNITLRIELFGGATVDCLPGIQDFGRPVVENLMLGVHSLTSVSVILLDTLFWCFRPKIITQCLFPVLNNKRGKAKSGFLQPGYWLASNGFLFHLCKKLMELESSHFCNEMELESSHFCNEKIICWYELEEVNAEIFEDMHMEWRILPWKTLFDALVSSEKEVQIRFRLRWGQP